MRTFCQQLSLLTAVCLIATVVYAEPAVVSDRLQASADQDQTHETKTSPQTLPELEVLGRQLDLIGQAVSASEGYVGRDDIAGRPRVRSGDLLELVPGMVATQHSGSGKANQYFLRGFNLDHGTDFATFVDAMPVNLRSHGHGQGYSDLNFLIPELVEALSYRKGTYYADVGDFSAAGSARFQIADQLPHGLAEASLGEFGYARGLLADSGRHADTEWLYGVETQQYDGPWADIDESVEKLNLTLRVGHELGPGRLHFQAMAYDNEWNAPDQIPARAVAQGLITSLGSLDATLGGNSSRYSVSGGWTGAAFGGDLKAQAYWIDSDFKLWSNFTYFLDDAENGDQFQQFDRRTVHGLALTQSWQQARVRWQIGLDYRHDDIDAIGLYRTRARHYLSTVREDSIDEQSIGIFVAADADLNDTWRLYAGLRQDWFEFEVAAGNPQNSGREQADLASAKLALVHRPLDSFEWYLSAGQGFHSNDARGVTLQVDPVSGEPGESADPLVRSEGAELGARWYWSERFHASLAYWHLHLDSELLFVGDAGNTEASFPSNRSGAELGIYFFPSEQLAADLEVSYTDASFADQPSNFDAIPGAIPWVVAGGVTWRTASDWSVGARIRHFGRYALIEDGSEQASGSTTVNLRVGRDWNRFSAHVEVLNLLDTDAHDIDYFYPSRLPGEPAGGIDDLHFHPIEPRAIRLSLGWRF